MEEKKYVFVVTRKELEEICLCLRLYLEVSGLVEGPVSDSYLITDLLRRYTSVFKED